MASRPSAGKGCCRLVAEPLEVNQQPLWRWWPEVFIAIGTVAICYGGLGLHPDGSEGFIGMFGYHHSQTDDRIMTAGAAIGAIGVTARSWRPSRNNTVTR
jgi:hypothetical protein